MDWTKRVTGSLRCGPCDRLWPGDAQRTVNGEFAWGAIPLRTRLGWRSDRAGPAQPPISGHFQAAHRCGGGGEGVGFDAEALQHRDEEVRQRVIPLGIKTEMLPVLEAAAGEENR